MSEGLDPTAQEDNVFNIKFFQYFMKRFIFCFTKKAPIFVAVSIFPLLLISQSAIAQLDTVRIATYNLLHFPTSGGEARIPYFRTVIHTIEPDILLVQELETSSGKQTFLTDVLNYYDQDAYMAAPFLNNSLFYKNDDMTLQRSGQITTTIRNIPEYIFRLNGIRFILYSIHLKAGSADSNKQLRLEQAKALRHRLNILPDNTNFIAAGDYNFYNASEPGFTELTQEQSGNAGHLIDPINKKGYWHNNRSFADVHTQSTRSEPFGDGAPGGLDDRFDMILVSSCVMTERGMFVLSDSYISYGNDGLHINMSINSGNNTAVADSVADALYYASDHLPVYCDFVLGETSDVEREHTLPTTILLDQNYPNPFNAQTIIRYCIPKTGDVKISIVNMEGRLIKKMIDPNCTPGHHTVIWNGENQKGDKVSSGVYFYMIQVDDFRQLKKLLFIQ